MEDPQCKNEGKMKVLLLAGGDSSERDVSLNSGKAMYDAVTRLGHDVQVVDPASGMSLLDGDGNFLLPTSTSGPAPERKIDTDILPRILDDPELRGIDVVLICLHGGAGENGTLQCLLDLAGMRYTGSGMRSSAIAMDKALTKRLVTTMGIPTPEFTLLRQADGPPDETTYHSIRGKFTLPVIVKPNDSGSTVGLTKLTDWKTLENAVEKAGQESDQVLIEEYIAGRELTVAVLDGVALPVVEIKPKNGLYDYEAKYTKGMSQYFVPAEIPDTLTKRLQADALAAYKLLNCEGLVRVDFMVDEEGRHYFLELNTLPGMTELSLSPMAAKAVGIDFDHLIDRILQSALKKTE
jgi:D-alanine-D-alanine ligase